MSGTRRTLAMRRILASFTAVALAVGLAACTTDDGGVSGQYRAGENKGFIAGDGSVQEIPVAERGEQLSFTGTGIDGATVNSADFAGQVLVLNFWFAGCAPCRVEAPLLQEVSQATAPDAAFLGVNIYDGPEQARSFETEFGITYPSLLMVKDVDLKLAFVSVTQISAAPTTLVLDKQGRVAARFIGAVQDESILRTIVQDLVAEES